MELANILAESSVLVCAEPLSKTELFETLAHTAAEACGHDFHAIREALEQRESLGSTGLGDGIAIPHGKVAGLNGVTAVFARLESPIDFDAVDDQPVDMVMMLLAPQGAGADHLKALSRVARLLRTEDVREGLRRSSDPKRLYAILTTQRETPHAA
ncbi:PTS IIA-like nitrogen-regulatory protein PtsN [Devosia pacifica]|uniref:PTS IIA-like nitrogen-regulatory protein PtsN n=1 Tax=Devosia pacifica TaxID=1335967 RepID=A0A918S3P8_9HYPH|nr:PTS sugar transporter subunit IIA [Devosia pacifica]GHA22397.1 PTS IIA-like nitrogen-regulatory protein PtsN [Devosia pacifica]